MFAVIKTGGKQYRVSAGDVLTVERLSAAEGETVQFNDVLMVGGEDGTTVGVPLIDGAGVQAEVLAQARGEKVISFKKRRRKHSSQRKKGHRQHLTKVRVTGILASGAGESGVKAAIGTGTGGVVASAPAGGAAVLAETGIRPGNLLDAPEGQADDLTRISGVGPGLNEKLNGLGVFHFRQIAAWGAEEIDWMDDYLSFKGRIVRDDWIGQAKALAAEAGQA
jgi:large subunit ribosomal protein L21